MSIFDRDLDIESIELHFIEPGETPEFGVGEIDHSEDLNYYEEKKSLRFTLVIKTIGALYRYEYVIQEKDGKFHYKEIESQKEGERHRTGKLELLEGESEIILHDHGDGEYRYYFHIAKLT